jgi:hypothetical protein
MTLFTPLFLRGFYVLFTPEVCYVREKNKKRTFSPILLVGFFL